MVMVVVIVTVMVVVVMVVVMMVVTVVMMMMVMLVMLVVVLLLLHLKVLLSSLKSPAFGAVLRCGWWLLQAHKVGCEHERGHDCTRA